jgi:hypothetical protein
MEPPRVPSAQVANTPMVRLPALVSTWKVSKSYATYFMVVSSFNWLSNPKRLALLVLYFINKKLVDPFQTVQDLT